MRAALVAVAVSITLGGCVTTAGIVKKTDVSLPLLIGATVADLVVTAVAASQITGYSYGGSVATALAVTGADVAVGCLLGACSSLRL